MRVRLEPTQVKIYILWIDSLTTEEIHNSERQMHLSINNTTKCLSLNYKSE
jgi:hypothetical protein